ncbi:MAG: DUF1871 family protein [Sideroxyarcus sp.]|nr:DUF1871 family protein [Sideroxyarcus sp.]
MSTPQVEAVARILAEWNPLGDGAKKITDLDGYRVEAADIVFGLKMRGDSVKPERHVMEVLNQAFGLKLDLQSCVGPAQKISAVLAKKE